MQAFIAGFGKDGPLIEDALRFFCHILFHGNMLNRMSFYVNKNPTMELEGECWPEDMANRTFVIEIRGAPEDDSPCETLAHELVHCKQWAKGQIAATSTIVARKKSDGVIEVATTFVETWHGKVWKPQRGEHPYFDAPWEVEAYGKALGLVARWNDYLEKKREKNKNEVDYHRADSFGAFTNTFDDSGFGYCGA